MTELQSMQNIGPVIAGQLQTVGIPDGETLQTVGSREAWLRILAMDPSACYNRLCGLEGAIRGMRKKTLPDATKADLKAFYKEHKG